MTVLMDNFRAHFPVSTHIKLTIETRGGRRFENRDIAEVRLVDDGIMLMLNDGSVTYLSDEDIAFLNCKAAQEPGDRPAALRSLMQDPRILTGEQRDKVFSMVDANLQPTLESFTEIKTNRKRSKPILGRTVCEPIAVKGHDPFEPVPDIEGEDFTIHGDGSIKRDSPKTGRVRECKIGFASDLPDGADSPMRKDVENDVLDLNDLKDEAPLESDGTWFVVSMFREDSDDFVSVVLNYSKSVGNTNYSRMTVYFDGDEDGARAFGEEVAHALNAANVG